MTSVIGTVRGQHEDCRSPEEGSRKTSGKGRLGGLVG